VGRIEERAEGKQRRSLEALGLERLRDAEWQLRIAALGAVLVFIGVFGPWTKGGPEGSLVNAYFGSATDDGKLFLLCAVASGVALWRSIGRQGGPELIASAVAGLIILLGSLRDLDSIEGQDEQLGGFLDEGQSELLPSTFSAWGLWLVIAGGLIIVIGSTLAIHRRIVMTNVADSKL